MRRSGLRRTSKKRRLLNLAVKEFRVNRVLAIGFCMICGHSPAQPWRDKPPECSQLCVHEIANGQNREKALDKPYATLVTCFYCNGEVVTDKAEWPQARQLARLLTIDPASYDLHAFNLLVNVRATNRISENAVLEFCAADALDVASMPALRINRPPDTTREQKPR